MKLNGARLDVALKITLGPHQLQAILQNEVLLVTTNARVKNLTPTIGGTANRALAVALKKIVRVEFQRKPLKEVLRELQKAHGFRIEISDDTLKQRGIDLNEPVTLELRDIQLKSVLGVLANQLQLTCIQNRSRITMIAM